MLYNLPASVQTLQYRTEPTNPLVYPRKKFNVLSLEGVSEHEEVNGIPTDPFPRLPMKCHIHPLLLQIVSQDNRFVRQDLVCDRVMGPIKKDKKNALLFCYAKII